MGEMSFSLPEPWLFWTALLHLVIRLISFLFSAEGALALHWTLRVGLQWRRLGRDCLYLVCKVGKVSRR